MKKQGVFLLISNFGVKTWCQMRRSINIARQAGKPEGWLGRLIAYIMSFETSKANKIALDLEELSDLLISEGFMIEHCEQDIDRKQSFFWTVASKRLTYRNNG
jgi:hypothetical protein